MLTIIQILSCLLVLKICIYLIWFSPRVSSSIWIMKILNGVLNVYVIQISTECQFALINCSKCESEACLTCSTLVEDFIDRSQKWSNSIELNLMLALVTTNIQSGLNIDPQWRLKVLVNIHRGKKSNGGLQGARWGKTYVQGPSWRVIPRSLCPSLHYGQEGWRWCVFIIKCKSCRQKWNVTPLIGHFGGRVGICGIL